MTMRRRSISRERSHRNTHHRRRRSGSTSISNRKSRHFESNTAYYQPKSPSSRNAHALKRQFRSRSRSPWYTRKRSRSRSPPLAQRNGIPEDKYRHGRSNSRSPKRRRYRSKSPVNNGSKHHHVSPPRRRRHRSKSPIKNVSNHHHNHHRHQRRRYRSKSPVNNSSKHHIQSLPPPQRKHHSRSRSRSIPKKRHVVIKTTKMFRKAVYDSVHNSPSHSPTRTTPEKTKDLPINVSNIVKQIESKVNSNNNNSKPPLPPPPSSSSCPRPRATRKHDNNNDNNNSAITTICVANVGNNVDEETVEKFFCKYGRLIRCSLMKLDPQMIKAYVQYADPYMATEAIRAANKTTFNGQTIVVTRAKYDQDPMKMWFLHPFKLIAKGLPPTIKSRDIIEALGRKTRHINIALLQRQHGCEAHVYLRTEADKTLALDKQKSDFNNEKIQDRLNMTTKSTRCVRFAPPGRKEVHRSTLTVLNADRIRKKRNLRKVFEKYGRLVKIVDKKTLTFVQFYKKEHAKAAFKGEYGRAYGDIKLCLEYAKDHIEQVEEPKRHLLQAKATTSSVGKVTPPTIATTTVRVRTPTPTLPSKIRTTSSSSPSPSPVPMVEKKVAKRKTVKRKIKKLPTTKIIKRKVPRKRKVVRKKPIVYEDSSSSSSSSDDDDDDDDDDGGGERPLNVNTTTPIFSWKATMKRLIDIQLERLQSNLRSKHNEEESSSEEEEEDNDDEDDNDDEE